MVTPSFASDAMFVRCIAFKGVSRGTRTRDLRSLRHTSAERRIRLSARPWAMAAVVAMLHGTTAIPSVGKVPLATGAVRSQEA